MCKDEILNREHAAKLCWDCQNHEKNGGNRASAIIRKAIENGHLVSAKTLDCFDCGAPAHCYDHRDYNKPYVVQPVCRKCNYRRGSAIPLKKTVELV